MNAASGSRSTMADRVSGRNEEALRSINLGRDHVNLGDYSQAIDYFRKSLELAKAVGDQAGLAEANFYMGDVYQKLEDYENAVSCLKDSLDISTTIGNQLLMAESNSALGSIYGSCLKKWEIAIEYYNAELGLGATIGDQKQIAKVNCNLGICYHELERNVDAVQCFKEMLRLMSAIGDQKGIAESNSRLGQIYFGSSEYENAFAYFKQALNIYNALDDKNGIKDISINLGRVHLNLDQYCKAIDCYGKSLEMAKAVGDQAGIARANCQLNCVYQRLREYKKAKSYLDDSFKIGTAIDDKSVMAQINFSLGNIFSSFKKKYEIAIGYYKKALEFSIAEGDQSSVAKINNSLGSCYISLGKFDEAFICHKKSLEIANTTGIPSAIAQANRHIGVLYRLLGDHEKAIEHGKKSLEISTDIGESLLMSYSYHDLASVHRRLGQHNVASTYLVKSIKVLEQLFQNTVPDENKLSFTRIHSSAQRDLTSCFVSLGRYESALLVTDLGRAKELHFFIERKHCENYLDTELFPYAQSVWSKIENGEENLEIERIQKILRVESDETSVVLFSFESKSSLNVWVLNSDVTFKCLMSNEALNTLESLMTQFSTRTSVNVNRDSSFFKPNSLANEHSFESHIISPPNKPSKRKKFAGLQEKNPSADHLSDETILRKLFHFLIQPIRDAIKGNKLIVVPHGLLFFVPFSSLIDENDRYLSQSYSIQVTPSLHTLTFTKEHPHDSDLGFALFVGNQKVGKISLYGTDFTPTDLPKAAEEVASLAKLFAARPLVKGEAKKQVVLGLLSGASIIHIAAHGEPKRGEIILAPDLSLNEPSSSLLNPASYLLTQNDITSISLQAHLVVLCCCHTGQGKISSEGVMGIARSFLAAGARSVLATLWPISDDATKEFMKAFYGELLQEIPVCEALRRVMNLFQQHERKYYRSFFIWAPFILYGEDVMFTRCDIETIREKSEKMFSGFVVLPSDEHTGSFENLNLQ
ncbi:tetratricopeptide repeat protein 28-like [Dendronephthya gigantea]|uniref:tetratricopeptide repeat protein 28-like n=1 Tax=Dendronephthya gigantea TaxID=151771 RepID=UPI00106B85C3|nr:tetratricopeptide repeat protein 28-like [Dendronephthya gigantea]